MTEIVVEVSLARTALKLGLNALDAQVSQVILMPDYCCDVLYHPLIDLGLVVKTYEIFDDLSPNWDQLNSINTDNVFGIIMVHYFGQPQKIELFKSYCLEKNIQLIEDNAHGYGGTYNGQKMGTFGDIGISSPRKILGLPQGGILYLKNNLPQSAIKKTFKKVPLHLSTWNFIKFAVYLCRPIYKYLANKKLKNFNYSDPYAFKEKIQLDTNATFYLKYYLKTSKIENIARARRKLWHEWHDYLCEKGLSPVFRELNENSSPWAIAFYADDITQRDLWMNWGVREKLSVFCWPSLPDSEILKNGPARKRWERMFFIILNASPPKLAD